jgi:CRP-like cAMP-binding protein
MLSGVETSMIGHESHKVELLQSVPLFAGLPKRELREIAGVADVIEVPSGRDLTVQGARGREFFVLLEGTVVVRRGGEFVNVLRRGSFFGEIALLADRPRSATVTTIEPSRLLVLTEGQFRGIFRGSSELAARVLPEVARRLAA